MSLRKELEEFYERMLSGSEEAYFVDLREILDASYETETSLDDATVERAAEYLPHDEQCGNSHLRDCGCKAGRINTARAVLAAAVEAGQ